MESLTQANIFIAPPGREFRRSELDDYCLAFENNPHPMWIFDEQTLAFLAVNESAIDQYGYSREEFLAMTLGNIRPNEKVENLFEELEEVKRNSRQIWFPHVCRHRTKKGDLLDAQVARIRLDYKGRPAVLSLNEDVTDRLQALERLHREHIQLEERVQQRTAELQATNLELKIEIAERQRLEKRNSAFSKLGHSLSSATSPKEAGQIIADVASDLLGWDAYSLDLYNAEKDIVIPILYFDLIENERTEINVADPDAKLAARSRRIVQNGPELVLKKPPIINDPEATRFGDILRPSASVMFAPIKGRGKIIGVLSTQSYQPDAYDQADLESLQALADHCAGALERISAEQALRAFEEHNTNLLTSANVKLQYEIYERYRLEKRNEALSKLGRSLSAARSTKEAALIIASVADELIGWHSCCLHLYLEDKKKVVRILTVDTVDGKRSTEPPSEKALNLPPIFKKVLKEGPQLILRKMPLSFAGELQPFGDKARPSASLMFVPVHKGDKVNGFFSIQSYRPNAYRGEDLKTLEVLADHCGGAMERIWAENALLKSEAQKNAILAAANAKLQREITERHRLEKELLETADNERRRIGHDLHDDVGQQLTGITLMAHGLEVKLAGKKLSKESAEAAKIRRLTVQALQRARGLAQGLASFQLDANDLITSLKNLGQSVEKSFKVSCPVEVGAGIPRLPAETVRQLHSISQEAVTNAVKHGKASCVLIQLAYAENILQLTVNNDGRRFSLDSNKDSGIGLRIMNYRASVIGATLQLKANGKRGTVLTCILPVKPQSQGESKR